MRAIQKIDSWFSSSSAYINDQIRECLDGVGIWPLSVPRVRFVPDVNAHIEILHFFDSPDTLLTILAPCIKYEENPGQHVL